MDDHPPPPEFKYYCELLTNIQQVSISISSPLPTSSTFLHPSKRVLLLSYPPSHPIPLYLPSRVSPQSPLLPSLSYRLPAITQQHPDRSDNVPWSASYFSRNDPAINCKSCLSAIIPSGKVTTWKDLPSENWADLMDFWHCHKPQEEGSEEKGKGKRYGNVLAKEGEGFVEMMFVLVDGRDIVEGSFEKSSNDNDNPTDLTPIHCTSCASPLGLSDAKANGYRLTKYSLSLSTSPTYTTSQWITAHLLFLIDTQAQRKFIVQSEPSSSSSSPTTTKKFQIWVFNPHTIITTHAHRKPVEAVKVYYKDEGKSSGGGGAGSSLQDPEVVYLPEKVYDEVWKELESGNRELPDDVKLMGEWRGSWLRRFGRGDV